ncbi:Hypothetical predicted protein [Octopus vulgaris]|uniref:Uncharacterized protein n=1 Tax=Octopus vulgaris TaxID=6645 RepID=A0AA36BLJ0_OCTVU|nr:Hypothetical predicted protein [Octopus vulgaris]
MGDILCILKVYEENIIQFRQEIYQLPQLTKAVYTCKNDRMMALSKEERIESVAMAEKLTILEIVEPGWHQLAFSRSVADMFSAKHQNRQPVTQRTASNLLFVLEKPEVSTTGTALEDEELQLIVKHLHGDIQPIKTAICKLALNKSPYTVPVKSVLESAFSADSA